MTVSSPLLTTADLARALRVTSSAVRAWVRRGCPTERQGAPGPGCGAMFRLDRVQDWRRRELGISECAPPPTIDAELLAAALWRIWSRPANSDDARASWQVFGIRRESAAALLVTVFREAQLVTTDRVPEFTPNEIAALESVAAEIATRKTVLQGSAHRP